MNGANGTSQPLKIIIVGAGIGGLTAAIGLRHNGHNVELYDSAQRPNEIGAAINVLPNASSVLLKLGIDVKESGAVHLETMRLLKSNGEILEDRDMMKTAGRWQSPWFMTHRAHLHEQLRLAALSPKGPGKPAQLHYGRKVTSVDSEAGDVTFSDNTATRGDVIVGADGVHSVSRAAINPIAAFRGRHSAFRFLVTRKAAEDDPITAGHFARTGCMDLWYSEDRKVVIYPCADNQIFNFVCIHPAGLSDPSSGYNTSASKAKLLEIFDDFSPVVTAILGKADPDTLKVYPLFDMEALPTYVKGRLALLGDAAHPFLPHLAQGAAMAIEDGVALSVMLSAGVSASDVPSRLQLYNTARYERAQTVQEYTRIVGGDSIKKDESTAETLTLKDYLEYGLSHDEYDASSDLLRRWQWSRLPNLHWRQPIGFGPSMGIADDQWRQMFAETKRVTASITFKTSATVLRNLLPTSAYSFIAKDTVALASIRLRDLSNLPWPGSSSYHSFGFYIHGVQYTTAKGEKLTGDYLAVMFEDSLDPAIHGGGEELGTPKVYSEIATEDKIDKYRVTMSWQGRTWAKLQWLGLEQTSLTSKDGNTDKNTLVHRYVPGVGRHTGTQSGTSYTVALSSTHTNDQTRTVNKRVCPVQAVSMSFDARDEQQLPTLHHIVSRLAELPVFEIVQSTITDGEGIPELSEAMRIGSETG